MKRLQYTWGYCVGVLLILLSLTVGTYFLWSTMRVAEIELKHFREIILVITAVYVLPPLIAGIGILKRKPFGWNIFHVLIALLIVFIPVVVWMTQSTGSWSWDRFSMGAMILDLILILFLVLQVRYWWRRKPLSNRNKIAV